MSKQTECCTPEGQIKRYLNCVGCDRKPNFNFMENKNLTAVEWLVNELKHWELKYIKSKGKISKEVYESTKIYLQEKAKSMEKQQSITDYCEGFMKSGEGWNGEYGLTNMLDVAGEINAEQYYNETYKGG